MTDAPGSQSSADRAAELARRWPKVIPDAVTAEVGRCAGIAQKAAFAAVGLEIAVFALAALAAPDTVTGTGPLVVLTGAALLTALPLRFVLAFRLSRGLVQPAVDMSAWSTDLARRSWRALDGRPETPPSAAAALERLEGRTGAIAERLRVTHLPSVGDIAGARAALTAWTPRDPVDRVRRARLAAWLDRLELDAADLDAVRELAAALPGEADRAEQLASVDLDDAIGHGLAGEPPLGLVARARTRLGALTYEALAPAERPSAVRARYRRTVAITMLPGVACVVAGAVIGLDAGVPALLGVAAVVLLLAGLATWVSGVVDPA